jgi:hypothetical protein
VGEHQGFSGLQFQDQTWRPGMLQGTGRIDCGPLKVT